MHNVDFPHNVPRRWINRVRATPGVAEVEPLVVGFSEMMLPDGGFEGVTVVGVEPASDLGRAWELVEGPARALDFPHGVVVDRHDDGKLRDPELGESREIGGRRARVVGKSEGVLSFLVTPYVFTTRRSCDRLHWS